MEKLFLYEQIPLFNRPVPEYTYINGIYWTGGKKVEGVWTWERRHGSKQ